MKGECVFETKDTAIEVVSTTTRKPTVDGNWGSWNSWSSCSQSCGVGVQSRKKVM